MTLVVNFYGGPGTGKSTSAAYVFAKLKMLGVNAELVREVAKEWCWAGRQIKTDADQYDLYELQRNRERLVEGLVDVLVTDCPVAVTAFYASKFCSALCVGTLCSYMFTAREHAEHMDVWLVRSKPYMAAGRYQNEEQARAIDHEQRAFLLGCGFALSTYHTDEHSLTQLVDYIAKRIKS